MTSKQQCRSIANPLIVTALHLMLAVTLAGADSQFQLELRQRVETGPKTGRFHTVTKPTKWNAKETAVIVCDMWDLHHCLNATKRGAEMAPRMNEVLNEARRRGATIVHAPSSCMKAYENHPARKRAMATPRAKKFPQDIGRWCHKIPSEEQGEYPIDQSDGGEDDDAQEHDKWAKKLKAMGRNPRAPWKSQTDLIDIHDTDYISDNGEEIWSVMQEKGIQNVILLGVHTNMCVLGRPFGLRNMARASKNVVLMRDMTDTMYNPARPPFVSHFTGTDLIVEHIEKWVCPTITSDQLIGGQSFVFKNDRRPHVVIVMAEREYKTNVTLPKFALKHLGKDFRVSLVYASEDNRNDLPGIDVLAGADVALISVRRRVLPARQMRIIREFIESGKPVVGVRTASHAFSLRGKPAPEGYVAWEKFDQEVFGGNYSNHYGNGPKTTVQVAENAAKHPILAGVDVEKLVGNGSLYRVSPLAKSAKPLLVGSIPDKPAEPIAWTNTTKFGGRAFYTSLAHPEDFEQKDFNRLLRNAIVWAVGAEKKLNSAERTK